MVSDPHEGASRAMLAASIIATDVKGRREGAKPLCSLEEIDFLLAIIDAEHAPTDLPEADSKRLRRLFARARRSPHLTLRRTERLRRLLQAVDATLRSAASRP